MNERITTTSLEELNYRKDNWRTMVICPNCREDNAPSFRFCGMCGASLEPRRPAGAPLDPLAAFPQKPKLGHAPESPLPLTVENATRRSSQPVPPIGGPSMLGLNQPVANQSSPTQPGLESLRENAFSGLDSFFEPEQPKTGVGRILLIIVLLAALGGASWWTYSNYLGAAEGRKLRAMISNVGQTAAEKLSAKPAAPAAKDNDTTNKDTTPAPDAGSPPASAPTTGTAEGQSGKAAESVTPDAVPKTADAEAKPATETKPATPAKTARAEKSAAKRERRATLAKAPKLPLTAAPDSGDADFQRGAAYLYGRGVHENCDAAVKSLKAASAKSNAKARSAFGTMYATGHCVPRDLPTSYSWFARALQEDPNNQILEKDLNAVWNQMTPPERQMATKMKQ